MRFEWDEQKRLSNIARHAIDFLLASKLFDGRLRLDLDSPRGNEQRILSIGQLGNKLVAIAWTLRGRDVARIISARRARHEEERAYRQLYN